MIQIENVTKTYSKSRTKAVDDLSLQTRDGEIFGFIGPNGAGKTTTIKMLVGILKPDSGRIAINGIDFEKSPIELKSIIGYVPDSHDIYDRLTGIEYLNFIGDIYSVPAKARKANIEKYLAMFNLEKAAGEIIRSYSHGMKQKIIVAAALMHEPRYWILDEPMTGLDPKSAHLLKQEMKAHCARGNTVFFSTHVLEVVEHLCDRIGIIDDGKLIALGTLEELRSKAQNETSLEKIFFKLTEEPEGGE
jgi:ABC-2 type transport system ATP-binding protein